MMLMMNLSKESEKFKNLSKLKMSLFVYIFKFLPNIHIGI